MLEVKERIHHIDREVVRYCYNNLPNYQIEINNDVKSDLCAIYFASNGIDFTCKTDEDYERVMIKKNRFEWKKNTIASARKHIFIRDVFKEYYVEGINKELNSCNKVYEFLKAETENMRVITVGSSSGGYAAAVFGLLLKAECIFSFTGQFNLYHMSLQSNPHRDPMHNPLLYKHLHDPEYNQYYDLRPLMKTSSIPIFYFTSNHRLDYMQKLLVKSFYCVYEFDLQGNDHVFPCYVFNLRDVVNTPADRLKELSEQYRGRTINKFLFSVKVSGFFKSLKGYVKMKSKPVNYDR